MATHLGFSPGRFHGPRNLAGYSPWGLKESDTTEQLTYAESHGIIVYSFKYFYDVYNNKK